MKFKVFHLTECKTHTLCVCEVNTKESLSKQYNTIISIGKHCALLSDENGYKATRTFLVFGARDWLDVNLVKCIFISIIKLVFMLCCPHTSLSNWFWLSVPIENEPFVRIRTRCKRCAFRTEPHVFWAINKNELFSVTSAAFSVFENLFLISTDQV